MQVLHDNVSWWNKVGIVILNFNRDS